MKNSRATQAYRTVATIAAMALLVGCASRTLPAASAVERPPADLSIAVTVVSAEGGPLQPATYIVEPGGLLRAATGRGATTGFFPPRTRDLSDTQVNALLGEISREGLELAALGLPISADSPVVPRPGQSLVVVAVNRNDARSTAVFDSTHPPAFALANRMRTLARIESP